MKLRILATIVAAIFGLCSGQVQAEIVETTGTFNGIEVRYFVVLPDGFDSAREYPGVLAFGGGSQTPRITRGALENHWVSEAEQRGYIIISPAAPSDGLFFGKGALIFPEFLDQILSEYRIEGGRFHIAGRSNGGLSAFHVAASHPAYFRSVTGFPGYLQPATSERLEALSGMCIYLHVGEFDPGWRRSIERQFEVFRARGLPTQFAVEEGMGHGLDSLAGEGSRRLFEHFEHAAEHCG